MRLVRAGTEAGAFRVRGYAPFSCREAFGSVRTFRVPPTHPQNRFAPLLAAACSRVLRPHGPTAVSRFHTPRSAGTFVPSRQENVREGYERGRTKVLEHIDPVAGGLIAGVLWIVVGYKFWVIPALRKGKQK